MSTQQQIANFISTAFNDAEIKKLDKDNFLDIHLPFVHPKKGTHLFFNTGRNEIKFGFYCREKDFTEHISNINDEVEKYSQGVRLKGNPSYQDAKTAFKAAIHFINIISGKDSNSQQMDARGSIEINLSDDQIKKIKYQTKKFASALNDNAEPKRLVKIKVTMGNGLYEDLLIEDDDLVLECTMGWNHASYYFDIPLDELKSLFASKPFHEINSEDLSSYERELDETEDGNLDITSINGVNFEKTTEVVELLKGTSYEISDDEDDDSKIDDQMQELYSKGDITSSEIRFNSLTSLKIEKEGKSVRIDWTYWQELYKLQDQFFDNEEYENAIAVSENYLEWVDESKEIANANYAIGRSLEELGQKEEAFNRYSTVVKFDKFFLEAYYNAAYLKAQEPDISIGILTEGIKACSDDSNTPDNIYKLYQLRGQLHANSNRNEEAEADLIKGNNLKEERYEPSGLYIYILGMAQFNLKKFKESYENLKRAGELEDRFISKQILNTRGECLRKLGELKGAIEEYILANTAEENAYSLFYIGTLFNKLGDYKQAEPYLAKLIIIQPQEKINYKPYIKCLKALGNFNEVIYNARKLFLLMEKIPFIMSKSFHLF